LVDGVFLAWLWLVGFAAALVSFLVAAVAPALQRK
jgi:hypothetical protein